MANPTFPGPESIHQRQLANGITVLVYENFAAESVVVEGYFPAGALSEQRSQAGLAQFTAGMLMRGTKQRTFAEIYEALESVGATLEFDSGRHTTDFSIASLVEDLDLVLELLAESLRYPTFPADEVEQERGEILTGLQIRENDTRQMAGLKFRELLYGNHPYGRSPQGYSETIKELTRDDLARFHELHYGPSGMVIVVVGAVKADEAVGKIEAVLGDWQNSNWQPLPALPAVEPPIAKQRIYHSIPEKTQADIVLGWVGPERARPDYMAASMANTVLGVFGMMGRLGKNVREEQGLAYYAYSRLQGGLGQGPWLVSTGVAPEHVEVAIDSILEEVRRMREELTPDEELNDSKAYRTGSLPVSLETNDGIAGIISDMVLYDLGLDYLYRFPEIVNAISPAELQETAQRYMPLDTVSIAVVGPPL
jgi:zinc protease